MQLLIIQSLITVCVLSQPFASTLPACCLPFAISLLVSLWPEYPREKKGKLKKKRKRGGGRQSKPFELLPVLSKVSGGRGSMQVHKRFLDYL